MNSKNICCFIPEMNFSYSVWQYSFRCTGNCSCTSWNKIKCVFHSDILNWK